MADDQIRNVPRGVVAQQLSVTDLQSAAELSRDLLEDDIMHDAWS